MICGSDAVQLQAARALVGRRSVIIRSVLALPWTTACRHHHLVDVDEPGRVARGTASRNGAFVTPAIGASTTGAASAYGPIEKLIAAQRYRDHAGPAPTGAAPRASNGGSATRSTGSSIRRRTCTARAGPDGPGRDASAIAPDRRDAFRPPRSHRATTERPASPRGSAPRPTRRDQHAEHGAPHVDRTRVHGVGRERVGADMVGVVHPRSVGTRSTRSEFTSLRIRRSAVRHDRHTSSPLSECRQRSGAVTPHADRRERCRPGIWAGRAPAQLVPKWAALPELRHSESVTN